jgi:hypothetical protein
MIRYDLRCEAGHTFDSWFRDSASYDDQAKRGLVCCPACGTPKVEKQIMAPAVARTDRDIVARPRPEPEQEQPAAAPVPAPAGPVALISERERAFREMVREFRRIVTEKAENVGPRFAEEARAMHEGLSEFRAIYGEATQEEARALREEGIDAFPLPSLPDERN